ncbi:protein FAR-RED ELONGATED HYPOCOTYL 1-like [Cucumis melo var. makuwa]|uniref:Protein FAR-RED ELONGATED HYPOCOTYL 1-like n=1 Tax=Cucumis melo var. makuwa TaxID=1194695 RepID=A0A5A7SRZ2_CUCMM|nr:protein FAR-RED ELONGATED HYPOCOTYL 1-like [Cucumis melo var. makuwa]
MEALSVLAVTKGANNGSSLVVMSKGYENGDTKQCTDQELEELFYSNGLNPNTYILSSGRWAINHACHLLNHIHSLNAKVQSRARAPTIDQEFEQYFSMLMFLPQPQGIYLETSWEVMRQLPTLHIMNSGMHVDEVCGTETFTLIPGCTTVLEFISGPSESSQPKDISANRHMK